jgi:hypothetical protein
MVSREMRHKNQSSFKLLGLARIRLVVRNMVSMHQTIIILNLNNISVYCKPKTPG